MKLRNHKLVIVLLIGVSVLLLTAIVGNKKMGRQKHESSESVFDSAVSETTGIVENNDTEQPPSSTELAVENDGAFWIADANGEAVNKLRLDKTYTAHFTAPFPAGYTPPTDVKIDVEYMSLNRKAIYLGIRVDYFDAEAGSNQSWECPLMKISVSNPHKMQFGCDVPDVGEVKLGGISVPIANHDKLIGYDGVPIDFSGYEEFVSTGVGEITFPFRLEQLPTPCLPPDYVSIPDEDNAQSDPGKIPTNQEF